MSYSTVDVRALRARMQGSIVMAGEGGWADAREAWSLAPEQRPVALALPATSRDLALLAEFAQIHGLPYAEDTSRGSALDGALAVSTARLARAA
jgi:hypothetical protein